MDESGIPNPTKDAPRERTGAAPTVPETGQSITPWLMVVPVVVCFSGGLFGYDHVISGAPHGFKVTFWPVSYTHLDVYKRQADSLPTNPRTDVR